MASDERPRVLIIDTLGAQSSAIQQALSRAGMEVVIACGDRQGLELYYMTQPDLVLLGAGEPMLEPWEVCRCIRSVSNVPIMVLATEATEPELLHAFSLGADEYLARAADPALLVACAEALLRRAPRRARRPDPRIIQAGDIWIDMLKREARLRGKTLPLSHKKLELLAALVRHAGHVVPYRDLLSQVWGDGQRTKMACLSVYIHHLRCCIEDSPHRPKRIVTVRGFGYRFVPDAGRE